MWNNWRRTMNNTLRHGLTVLQHLATTTEPFAVSGLAEALHLPKSQVHRLLQGLVEDGWVIQDADRRYRIGLKPLELSSALLAHLPLRRAALPVVRQLVSDTGHDAILAQLVDGAALVLVGEYAAGRQQDPATAVGRRLALHSSACGQLLAGMLSHDEQAKLLARAPFPAFSPLTRTTATAVQAAWTAARLNGVAVQRGENGSGGASLAVPVRDQTQRVVAALGIALPIAACDEPTAQQLTARLHAAADTITRPGVHP